MRPAIAGVLLFAVAAVAQQTTPPAPSAPRQAKLPRAVEKRFSNGLRVIVVPKHGIPLVAAQLLVRTGAEADPVGREGVAQFTAELLSKGTKMRTAEEIARGVEALGATLESEAWWDGSMVDLSVMPSNLAAAMVFMADVARNAAFAEDEVELHRAQAADRQRVVQQQPPSVAALVASRVLFGGTAYGHSPNGTLASLSRIGRDDLVAFHRRHYRPANAVLVLAGDVRAEEAFAIAERAFGSWKGSVTAPAGAASAGGAVRPRRVVVVDMPGAGQASVIVVRLGIRRADPSYFRALVANSVLGEGYSSRLNQEIRIRRGLSYSAASSFQPRILPGPFVARADTKNESAAEVARLIVEQMNALGSAPVPDQELTTRKAALLGSQARALETTAGLVTEIASLALHGLPLTEIERHAGGVQAVTAEQVREFARASLRGDDASIVIAGDAAIFLDALRERHGEVEVIPLADLDLDGPELRERKAKR